MMLYALALAAAAAFEDLGALDAQIAVAARAMGATAVPVDRRLRLPSCVQGVQIDAPDARALAVRCPGGWRLRVALNGAPQSTAAAPIVRRGDPVTVVSEGDGFAIETSGIAAEDGPLGAGVRLRVDKVLVTGIVTGPQRVSVGGLNVSGARPLPLQRRDGFEEFSR